MLDLDKLRESYIEASRGVIVESDQSQKKAKQELIQKLPQKLPKS